ncbi:AbrB/MazE/SpoVT family DNA-binding domain-containing protein [bacterium]|jgi:putative addiction module antidote|nr:AbrB/MazE/SpoVT family DNA-binding domain-containing protein [bacterium]
MTQKIIKVGNSLGITLPKEFVKQANLSTGHTVTTAIEANTGVLKVQTNIKNSDKLIKSSLSPQFVKRVDSFIKRHKPALEKLARL